MENPIKENRIVKDKTFALRLLGFALDVDCADACSEDEKRKHDKLCYKFIRISN